MAVMSAISAARTRPRGSGRGPDEDLGKVLTIAIFALLPPLLFFPAQAIAVPRKILIELVLGALLLLVSKPGGCPARATSRLPRAQARFPRVPWPGLPCLPSLWGSRVGEPSMMLPTISAALAMPPARPSARSRTVMQWRLSLRAQSAADQHRHRAERQNSRGHAAE